MSFETGKFMIKYLKGKRVEMYTGDQSESINYADNDSSSYSILVGTVVDYDVASGVITLETDDGKRFYVAEVKIHVFWESDSQFDILEITRSTIKTGWMAGKNKNKKRDIM